MHMLVAAPAHRSVPPAIPLGATWRVRHFVSNPAMRPSRHCEHPDPFLADEEL